MPAEEVVMKPHPCAFCDYIFTLLICLASVGVVVWSQGAVEVPWWIVLIVTHMITANWFIKTRP